MTEYASVLKKQIENTKTQSDEVTYNCIIKAVDTKISIAAGLKKLNTSISTSAIAIPTIVITKEVISKVEEHYKSFGYGIKIYDFRDREMGGSVTIEISWE